MLGALSAAALVSRARRNIERKINSRFVSRVFLDPYWPPRGTSTSVFTHRVLYITRMYRAVIVSSSDVRAIKRAAIDPQPPTLVGSYYYYHYYCCYYISCCSCILYVYIYIYIYIDTLKYMYTRCVALRT